MHSYKTYVIDFDSTLVKGESLDMLATIALATVPQRSDILAELQNITTQGMNGDISFDESLRRRLRLFSANKTHVNQLVAELKGSISTSASHNLSWFEKHRDSIYVISGGFADYIEPVVSLLGIQPDHVFANRFVYNDQGDITGFAADNLLCRAQGKVAQLAELQLARPLVIIGDGYTDYEAKEHGQADQFWALTENIDRPAVTIKADRVLAGFAEI
jgi:D-3-phosphoglycerate dehydrogenase